MNLTEKYILLTFDVEDWFQVENFKECIPFSSWECRPFRFEGNTHLILDLLDEFKIKATFFVLGWNARCVPHLIREIHARGHEVASHGYYHNLCNVESLNNLKTDLTDSKKVLEDVIGSPIYGYRAPSFSVSEDILPFVEECGFVYDSSYNSFGRHSRYGKIDLTNKDKHGIAFQISKKFYELPVSNIKIGKYVFPWGGGGYFRLIPSSLFNAGVRMILKKQKTYLFYLHPWELDPEQPKVRTAPLFYRLRHYTNLNKTAAKLSSLIKSFNDCRFITCYQYIDQCKKNVR